MQYVKKEEAKQTAEFKKLRAEIADLEDADCHDGSGSEVYWSTFYFYQKVICLTTFYQFLISILLAVSLIHVAMPILAWGSNSQSWKYKPKDS